MPKKWGLKIAETAWADVLDSLQPEPQGMILYFIDDEPRAIVRDHTTAANNFNGLAADKLTYTAPSAKYIMNSEGLLESASTIRCEWSGSTKLGLRIEEARTNVCLWNRDLTNAAWTATNITAAKNQTGADGSANAASSITATAGNATILQSITLASSTRYQSAYVKRITGSGTINMTTDGGSTWNVITVTSAWTRVGFTQAAVTNPNVGFRIVTSGDAIAVDFVQNETGAFITSPIATTSGTATRAADDVTLATSAMPFSTTAGYVLARVKGAVTGGVCQWSITNGTTAERLLSLYHPNNYHFFVADGDVAQAILSAGENFADIFSKTTVAWATNDFGASVDGGAAVTDSSGTLPTVTTLRLGGNYSAGIEPLNGHVAYLKYLPRRITNAQLQSEST